MDEALRNAGTLFTLIIILGGALYLFLNFNPSPTGEVTLVSEASFGDPGPDGDINQDGEVDIFDVVKVVRNVGKTDFEPRTDLNEDGKVDQEDMEIIKSLIK